MDKAEVHLLAALCAAFFVPVRRCAACHFYLLRKLELVVKAETVFRTTYLPLIDIVNFMRLSYTDALAGNLTTGPPIRDWF
jgi:hypothetical protein